MIAAERQQRILEYVERNRSAKVTELAKLVMVTEETIRRDLEKLENDSLLKRMHGGAMAIRQVPFDLSFAARETLLIEEKTAIANSAIKHVQENDTILLDASSTVLELAKKLPDMPMTVVTNSYHLIIELAGKREITVVSLGGSLDRNSMSFLGPSTENALENLYIDKLFLSCRCVDVDHGVSDAIELQAALKRIMMRQSRERYLLVDYTKFDKKSISVFGSIDDFDEIICDEKTDKNILDSFGRKSNKIKVSSIV